MKSYNVKCVFLGDSTVGKTSLLNRLLTNNFNSTLESTIGASYIQKLLEIDEDKIFLQIWDTAGQERYRSLIPMYLRGVYIALIVYDITCKISFENLSKWVELLRNYQDIHIIIISNKNDLHNEYNLNIKGLNYANSINAKFFDVSAKSGANVDILYKYMIKKGKEIHKENKKSESFLNTSTIKLEPPSMYKTIQDISETSTEYVKATCCNTQ